MQRLERVVKKETDARVVVCAISGVFIGATLVSRSGVKF